MADPPTPQAHGHDFDGFLYALVGEDRNGANVTVLSTLARLGFDPWAEAADMAELGREAARARLAMLLSGFRDVPILAQTHGAVAHELSLLLPTASEAGGQGRATWPIPSPPKVSIAGVLAILALLLILSQMLFASGAAAVG